MLDRRTFLLSSASFGLFAASGCATRPRETAEQRDQALHRILQAWFDEDLLDSPTFATNLGLDVGGLSHLRARLGDNSRAKLAEERAEDIARHRLLTQFGRQGLSPASQLTYDIAMFRQSLAAEGARYPWGGLGRPAPYVVSQLGGSYYSVPDFLDSQHPVRTREDAEAYLSRLQEMARNLDNETDRAQHDASVGVVPPDFALDKAIANLERLRAMPAAQTTLVRSIARRAAAASLGGDYEGRAAALVSGPIAAALDRQIAALKTIRRRATHDAGVWKLPAGESYYQYALKANNTTTMTGEEVHRMGLEQVRDLHARLDTLLRAQGYTRGTVGERINALNGEERFLWPNTDAGRAELLASLNRQIAQITPLMPRMFNTIPRAALEIRRVPVEIEAGAPGGYYQGAPLDNSRPGVYYINLKDTHEWPKLGLPTLTWHEGVPGHHFQISIAREQGELPIYRRTGGFSAYSEGWALYAERVADELGVYENDPFGKIGYLQSYLFRATRLVVDSGLHHKRWTREQAIRWMVDNAAEPEGSAVREIERYSVWPGQATAYKIGQTVIENLREEAERRMGSRFDIKAFHDVVLLGGAMPLTVLERRVREWIG
jgi:uncharacterized protein (DUF885 family)